MSTRRAIPWLLLFLITLPTVMATADAVQRAQADGTFVVVPPLAANAVYVYDLDVETLDGPHDGHYADYLRIEVGEPQRFQRLDGTHTDVLPVTATVHHTPFDKAHLSTIQWAATHVAAFDQERTVTTHYDLATGLPVETHQLVHSETWDDGDHHVEDVTTRTTSNRDALIELDTFGPGSRYLDGNMVTYMIATLVEADIGHVQEHGVIDGRPAYQVSSSEWTDKSTEETANCWIPGLEMWWYDQEKTEAWKGRTISSRSKHEAWVNPDTPLPVAGRCLSTRHDADGNLVHRWDLRTTLRVVDPGDQAVDIRFRDPRDEDTPTPTADTSVLLPGLPQTGDLDLPLSAEDALQAILAHDDGRLQRFQNAKTVVPFAVHSATYRPTPYDTPDDPDDADDGPLPTVPTLPVAGGTTGDVNPRATHRPTWSLKLFNFRGETLDVQVDRMAYSDGTLGPIQVDLEDRLGNNDEPHPQPKDYPTQMVPFDVLFDALHTRADRDPATFADDPNGQLGSYTGVYRHRTDDGPWEARVSTTLRGAVTLATPDDPDYDPDHRFTVALDGLTGAVEEESRQRAEVESATAPPAADPRPASAQAVRVEPYVPTAALSSGAAVVLAFVVAYGWGPMKHGFLHGLVAPLYAKLRKDRLLDHAKRQEIVDYVDANPGATVTEVRRHLGAGYGTTVHHLDTLVRNSLLATEKEGRERHYYATGHVNASRRIAVALVRNASARRLLDVVANEPGITQRGAAARLDVKPSSVRFQAKKLIDAGLLRAETSGRVVHYHVDDDAFAAACGDQPTKAQGAASSSPAPGPSTTSASS